MQLIKRNCPQNSTIKPTFPINPNQNPTPKHPHTIRKTKNQLKFTLKRFDTTIISSTQTGTWHTQMQMEKDREYFFLVSKLIISLLSKIVRSRFLFNCFSVLSVLYWISFFYYLNTNQSNRKSLKFIQLSAFIEYNKHEICNPRVLKKMKNWKKFKKKKRN